MPDFQDSNNRLDCWQANSQPAARCSPYMKTLQTWVRQCGSCAVAVAGKPTPDTIAFAVGQIRTKGSQSGIGAWEGSPPPPCQPLISTGVLKIWKPVVTYHRIGTFIQILVANVGGKVNTQQTLLLLLRCRILCLSCFGHDIVDTFLMVRRQFSKSYRPTLKTTRRPNH